jgi:hypothetical protein
MASLYRKRKKLMKTKRNFTRVKNLEFDKEGEVTEFLATQFLVEFDDGTEDFFFYNDEDVTWKALDKSPEHTKKAEAVNDYWDRLLSSTPINTITTNAGLEMAQFFDEILENGPPDGEEF